jgi:hypothetical protein
MYVPEGWHHAVLNKGEVLAAAIQPHVAYSRPLLLLNAVHSSLSSGKLSEAHEVRS